MKFQTRKPIRLTLVTLLLSTFITIRWLVDLSIWFPSLNFVEDNDILFCLFSLFSVCMDLILMLGLEIILV